MDIGGTDLVVECHLNVKDSVNLVTKIVEDKWPECVFEDVDDDSADLFMYENAESKRLWDTDVPAEEAQANMIYALFEDKQVTLVYDKGTGSEEVAKYIALYLMKLNIMANNPAGVLGIPAEEINGADTKTT